MFQVGDEPCYHSQCDALARAEHQLAFHCIQRKGIHDDQAAVAIRADFTREFGALADGLSQNSLGETGSQFELFGSRGDDFSLQFFGGFQRRLKNTRSVFGIILFLMLFESYM